MKPKSVIWNKTSRGFYAFRTHQGQRINISRMFFVIFQICIGNYGNRDKGHQFVPLSLFMLLCHFVLLNLLWLLNICFTYFVVFSYHSYIIMFTQQMNDTSICDQRRPLDQVTCYKVSYSFILLYIEKTFNISFPPFRISCSQGGLYFKFWVLSLHLQ